MDRPSRSSRALRLCGAAALAAALAGVVLAFAGSAESAWRAIAFALALGGLTLTGAAILLFKTWRQRASQEI